MIVYGLLVSFDLKPSVSGTWDVCFIDYLFHVFENISALEDMIFLDKFTYYTNIIDAIFSHFLIEQ